MIAILDYGVGNLFSLSASLKALGLESVVTRDPQVIRRADRIILPGGGAFGDALNKLNETGLPPLIREEAAGGKPLLGICLGMQLLFEKGYEYGEHRGLGLIPGQVAPLAPDLTQPALKVPHMGWNKLHLVKESPLFQNTREGDSVYFVHSYYAKDCREDTLATADYSIPVTAAVGRGNVYGTQFHPEKSGRVGLEILRAFARL